jgi:mono/diheme cytochrome c family protein
MIRATPFLTLALAATFLVLASAPADSAEESEEARGLRLARAARMVEARNAYERFCAACHGKEGRGRGVPGDLTSPAAVANLTRESMVTAARSGHAEEAARTWQQALGEPALDDVVDYIREALMLPAPVADAGPGRNIYARTCSVCHGERGDGASWAKNSLNPSPADFTTEDPRKLTRQEMINAATYGSPGTAMMPFASQFSREEIISVVDYIRSSFMKADVETAAHDDGTAQGGDHAHGGDHHNAEGTQQMAARPEATGGDQVSGHQDHGHHDHAGVDSDPLAPFPAGIVGDYWQGKTFFESNCVECHGLKGDGEGRRAYFMRRKPKDFTTERARADYNRPHLFEAIAKGVRQSEMPAWSKVIDAQTIANVAEYVFLAFLHPEDAPAARATTPQWQREPEGETKKN